MLLVKYTPAGKQADDEHDKKKKKQNFGDIRRSGCDAAETQYACYKCDDEKGDCPT